MSRENRDSATQTTRRAFYRNCLSAGAVASLGAGTARAVSPIERPGDPKFKLSLAAYSYRDLLTSGEMSLAQFVDDCAAMQLDATELTSYYFPESPNEEFLRNLKAQCFRLGLAISGTAVGNDFGHPLGERRDREIAHVKRWIEYAEILGAPVIRIFAGHVHNGEDAANVHSRFVEAIEDCCDYAGRHGVHLALENHGGPTATAEGLLAIVRDVKSPWFGVNLDTGNFYSDHPYDELARVAPYALNVQVKVVTKDPSGQQQPTDFGRLAGILRDSGYRGYVALEYEEQGDPRVECRKFVDQLREALA